MVTETRRARITETRTVSESKCPFVLFALWCISEVQDVPPVLFLVTFWAGGGVCKTVLGNIDVKQKCL